MSTVNPKRPDANPTRVLDSEETTYGLDESRLLEFYENLGKQIEVEVRETVGGAFTKATFHNIDSFKRYLLVEIQKSDDTSRFRTITITKISKDLLQLIGARFRFDYDLWTSRLYPGDREYFASPLNEKGARHFSHFHLACGQFFRATANTDHEYLKCKTINHSTRIFTLLDSRKKRERVNYIYQRMFVLSRVTGHIRRDRNAWTFIFVCDPFFGEDKARYKSDISGMTISDVRSWVGECVNEDSSQGHLRNLEQDGFGIIVKILRDIKSTWKLLLNEFEHFLEEINDHFDDEEFIDAASFLHRQFILSIDYIQRQLFYHRRYVTYLTSPITHPETNIVPTIFHQDLVQEGDALAFVDLRLKALRDRTVSVLEMILSLNSIKQARLASEMAHLQREDTQVSLDQGETVRRLTLLNMAFLPLSFIASVFGMNTYETQDTPMWKFVVTAVCLLGVTLGVSHLGIIRRSHWSGIYGKSQSQV